jgi:hypothetical protein
LTADRLWELGSGGRNDSSLRPVWIAYCGTERELQPFTANLRAGRKASNRQDAVVLPRSAFRWTTQPSFASAGALGALPSATEEEERGWSSGKEKADASPSPARKEGS